MSFSNDAFLTQLNYHPSDNLIKQLERIKKNTHNFNLISKHILRLNEQLKPYDSFVALSSSQDFIKIKNQADESLRAEVTNIINHWSEKYKIGIEKLSGKETYYVLGYEK